MAAPGYEFYLQVLKEILSAREGKIRIPKRPRNVLFILKMLMKFLHKTKFFYSFSKQQNSAIKVVTYGKMPVKKIL